MAEQYQTTWMWHDEATTGVMGAIIDFDDQVIQWVDQPGCACGDNAQAQSMRDFLDNGAAVHVPQDVLGEMQTEVNRFMVQVTES